MPCVDSTITARRVTDMTLNVKKTEGTREICDVRSNTPADWIKT